MPVTVPTQRGPHNSLAGAVDEYPCPVAFFGWLSKRRGQKRIEQLPPVPAFRATMDCTPWVLDGLWPSELNAAGPGTEPGTEPVAGYLERDLRRIADSANQRLQVIAAAGLDEDTRRTEESRVFNVARAFAVLRVESTVRQLRREPIGFEPVGHALAAPRDVVVEPEVIEPEAPPEPAAGPEAAAPPEPTAPPAPVVPPEPAPVVHREPAPREAARHAKPDPAPEPQPELESDHQRLLRLVRSIARQEPGLCWAAGLREDGTPVLVTDLAHGWIPPGVDIPEGVELLQPARRPGSAADLVYGLLTTVTYTPGDSFGGVSERDRVAGSPLPRRVKPIDELSRRLTEATRNRRGLPTSVHTLMAATDRVPENQIDLLRVHLDTGRYQLLAQYPEANPALLLNCLLLAAAVALLTGDRTGAGYHFGWFTALAGEVAEPIPAAPGQHLG